MDFFDALLEPLSVSDIGFSLLHIFEARSQPNTLERANLD
jgi:hypothetical protein